MHSPNWSDDDELMGDLSAALVPTTAENEVIEAAQAAYAWRALDAEFELAELVYDSCVDPGAAVRGPAPSGPRMLVFGLGLLRIEIELSEGGIEGQLVPPRPGVVRLLTVTGCLAETMADQVGCFRFPARRRGPMRLACALGTSQVATDWINA